MLRQQNRLRARRDFEAVRQAGRRIRGSLMAINMLERTNQPSRFGFVVSRKVGGAVIRNRVRRRLRAAARSLLPGLRADYDIVIIAHTAIVQANYVELRVELNRLLDKAGLWSGEHKQAQP